MVLIVVAHVICLRIIAHTSYTQCQNTRRGVVHRYLLCDCCCTVDVRTRSPHTTHTRTHHDQTCIAASSGLNTHSSVRSCKQQQPAESKKIQKAEKMWVCSTQTCTHTYTHAYMYHGTRRNVRHRCNVVTANAGWKETWSMGCYTRRSLAVGAAAGDPHSCRYRRRCRCCSWCCVPARLGVERNKAWLRVTRKNWPCLIILQQQT